MDFAHPHFADPSWLWLALISPWIALLVLAWSARSRRRQIDRLFMDSHDKVRRGLEARSAPGSAQAEESRPRRERLESFPSHSPGRRRAKQGLIVLAMICMTIALARPQWGEQAEVVYSVGEDILFLMDCSQSMLATDVRPNRLARAKLAVADFIQNYPHGRLGLIAFAGQAFLQCPLTFDQTAMREALMALDTQAIPVPGTDLGRALQEGLFALEKNDRRKIMILVTDGEDLEETGVQVARELAAQGVVVFTLGVGTAAGSSVQVADEQNRSSPLRDAQGSIVLSRLDENTLRSIAEATQGMYQRLGITGEGLRRIQPVIEQFSPLPHPRQRRTLGIDRFHFPVALTMIALILESLMGARKRNSVLGTQPARVTLGVLLAGLGSLWLPPVAAQDDPYGQRSPDELLIQGTQELIQGKLREAEQTLVATVGMQQERVQGEALFNLGHVRFRQGQQALKEGPEPARIEARQKAWLDTASGLVQRADIALASHHIEEIVSAYRQSVSIRKQARPVTEAVKNALEVYRAALLRWERSTGDFKSAFELDAADQKARENGEIVGRHIARLVEQIRRLENALMQMSQIRKELEERMQKMRGLLPEDEPKEGDGDEDDEDEDAKPKPGDKEKITREGKEQFMSREEAARLLESLRIDSTRKLPMGMERTGQPRPRQGRTW